MKIKTIDITAKEWFDKVNGNSYFSAQVTINFNRKTEKTFYMPLQYGYGNHSEDMARKLLFDEKLLSDQGEYLSLSLYCRENKIDYRYNKQENCLKRDVKSFGEEL